jgi:preprotein translocase subunit SecA
VSLEDDLMRMFGSERIAKVMDFAGYKEGEVIQHSMITKSIERAQRKVEENNFGIRKRLLEYDDVMNKQRTVIYTKRSHALFGERLALDLDNAFYIVADGLVSSFKEQDDYEGFRLAVIVNFGIDSSITAEELSKTNEKALAERLYNEAIANYNRKKVEIAENALPVFTGIRKEQGAHIENVVVPFTDGRRGMQVVANLDKTVESKGYELTQALERNIALAFIDDAWKEHLRAMDDLKQSVQTASYEQKDPLVIYKMEAFGLFKKLDEQVNKDIVSFLCHAAIPVEQEAPVEQQRRVVHEAREQRTDMSKMRVNKDEIDARGDDYAANENDYFEPGTGVKQQPVVVGPKIGRNDPCPCGSGKKFKQCHGKDA